YTSFSFTATPPPPVAPLSLHDALPISGRAGNELEHAARVRPSDAGVARHEPLAIVEGELEPVRVGGAPLRHRIEAAALLHRKPRSEEHTSELQSPYDLVCRLLLEKKKK